MQEADGCHQRREPAPLHLVSAIAIIAASNGGTVKKGFTQMGYAHNHHVTKAFTISENTQNLIKAYLAFLQNHKGIKVTGCDEDDAEILLTDDEVLFNGTCETFYIHTDDSSRGFCKTSRDPYDAAVCGVLFLLMMQDDAVVVSSDGKFYENPAWFPESTNYCGWMTVVQWIQEELGDTEGWDKKRFDKTVQKLIRSLA